MSRSVPANKLQPLILSVTCSSEQSINVLVSGCHSGESSDCAHLDVRLYSLVVDTCVLEEHAVSTFKREVIWLNILCYLACTRWYHSYHNYFSPRDRSSLFLQNISVDCCITM
jgi:hypothetical protein